MSAPDFFVDASIHERVAFIERAMNQDPKAATMWGETHARLSTAALEVVADIKRGLVRSVEHVPDPPMNLHERLPAADDEREAAVAIVVGFWSAVGHLIDPTPGGMETLR